MAKATIIFLLKNDQTNWAKNYRPIVLQNIMLKLYTGCINQFLEEHCQRSNIIITAEQVGGKKEVLGCLEQLLITKTILEVTENRRSLITMWLY